MLCIFSLCVCVNSSDFVYDLFENMSVSESGGGRKPTMMGKRGGKPSRKKATVSSQFKVSQCLVMCGILDMLLSDCVHAVYT